MLEDGFDNRLHATLQHWHDWLGIAQHKLAHLSDEYRVAAQKSLMMLNVHTDEHGGILASSDSSIYNYGRDYYSYVWPRDGAYVIWPLIKLGYTQEAKRFFKFCKSVIHPDGYMMHKYQPDRAIGSTWHPLVHGKRKELAIQEDETAILVFMLAEYQRYSGDKAFVDEMFDVLVRDTANFMSDFIDAETGLPHASYDLWEEKFLTNTYTTAITAKALNEAVVMALDRGYSEDAARWKAAAEMLEERSGNFFDENRQLYVKGFLMSENGVEYDQTLDISSFFGAYMFEYGTQEHITMTIGAIEKLLLDISPSRGSGRYEDDNYFRSDPPYKGNPWFVTTLWVAQYYALTDQKEKASDYVDWTIKNSLPSGLLSEQISPEDSKIVGVTPLVWSHAELVNTILYL